MSENNPSFVVRSGGQLGGRIRVPGDKSVSHRAVMFGAVSDGVTEVRDYLDSEDVQATIAAFRTMGVQIDNIGDQGLRIHGVGIDGIDRDQNFKLDMGNSGTAMRLLTGLLAGMGVSATLSGDESLSQRPMNRIVKPLESMGASFNTASDGRPPLELQSNAGVRAMHYDMPVASAQVKSAVLLAGLGGDGLTSVTEPAVSRDHTERMLNAFGVDVSVDGARIGIQGGQRLTGCEVVVPSDLSSAAFFLVGAAICPGAELTIAGAGVNPTRDGVLKILQLMGAQIEHREQGTCGLEPVADLVVRGGELKGIDVPPELVPLAIDEFPALAIAAACAKGTTRITGAEELRVKETDRISAVVDGLKAIGVNCDELDDGMVIEGGRLGGGEVFARGDHRLAMAFSMAALRASDDIIVRDVANVATSFPEFAQLAAASGLQIEQA